MTQDQMTGVLLDGDSASSTWNHLCWDSRGKVGENRLALEVFTNEAGYWGLAL
jgi:hypothetical protein